MCGIAGFINPSLATSATVVLNQMAGTLKHRGPDAHSTYYCPQSGVGLAHARLAIVDLSPAGLQPMHAISGRYTIVFNGEIYNHLAIRSEIEVTTPTQWRGHSDTETLLAAIDCWGIEAALQKLVGMFAFALWDSQQQILSIARDRLGEKPLYYGWINDQFVFASELKAIKVLPEFDARINRHSLALLLRYNAIPAPHSIYQDIYKLEPGHVGKIALGSRNITLTPYWSLTAMIDHSTMRFQGNEHDAVTELDKLLRQSVKQQMVADVPLGAFLSGGVDSSSVVALMQAQSMQKIKTFTIGSESPDFNEADHARAVAQHLGTDHHELIVSAQDALAVIPNLPDIYDEPFADSSQLPTYLVAKLAKTQVTVSLSGDGGDELFGGYNRYTITNNLWHKINKLPLSLRNLIAKGITAIPSEHWDNTLGSVLRHKYAYLGYKLHKGASVLSSPDIRSLYQGLVSQMPQPSDWLVDVIEPETLLSHPNEIIDRLNPIESMMAYDTLTYLPNDILTKVDRAAMAVSLETRVPMLDHRIVEFAWSLPLEMKLRQGVGKWPLREVLYQYVPKQLIERPKMGFGIPLAEWLRSDLRDWAESLLNAQRLTEEGFFNAALVQKKWQEHLSGKQNWQYQLWNILMFQAWLDREHTR